MAIATRPDLLDQHGPTLHVDARSSNGKPVFVGVARDFDVASYLKGTAHTSLVQVEYPIALTTQDQKGSSSPLAAPDGLDWWVTKAAGAGTQSIAWPIADGPYDVVIMSADGKTAPDVQVKLGIEIPNAFLASLAVLVLGLLLIAGGIFLILGRRRRPVAPAPVVAEGYAPPQHQTPVGPLRRVVAVTAVLALVSGCSAIPKSDTVDALTRPAVTDDAAVALIKHYNEINNKANSTRSNTLIATVEGGALLRQDLADYTIDRAGKAEPIRAFTYTSPVIGAPTFGSYPMRFVSSAGITGNKEYRHLGLWERETAGSPWLMTFSAGPKATAKLPDLAGLRSVSKADGATLAAAPQVAANNLAAYLTGGAKSSHAAAFTPNADLSQLLAGIAKAKAEMAKQPAVFGKVTNAFTAEPSSAFMTKSGSALAFVTLTDRYSVLAGAGYQLGWGQAPETAFSPSAVKYQGALTKTTLHDAVLVIPPKGKGKIQILTFESQIVDAGGY
ncbi:hypothetical protein [Kribbella antiqua]|nr:hypothetical protein [Kribbella antiqua]